MSAAAGLVPSFNNVNTFSVDDSEDPTVHKIDNLKMRCSRLRRNLGVAAKLLSLSSKRCWMLTLTYADAKGWKPSDVRDCLQRLRVWLWRAYKAKLKYLWVMELQKRKSGAQKGEVAPHYHLVVWVPREVSKDELKLDDRGYWPHGHTNAVEAVAPVNYVMKYASKFDNQGDFPKGARCNGRGGLDMAGRNALRWLNYPSFVQGRASVNFRWTRRTGGGWTDTHGTYWPSEWALIDRTSKGAELLRVFKHPRLVDPSGPFSWLPAFTGHAA